jgi:hypothetical protein
MTGGRSPHRLLTPRARDALQGLAKHGPAGRFDEHAPNPPMRRRLEAAGYIEQVPITPFSIGLVKFRITAAGLRALAQSKGT